jgi:outer membrane protein
MNRIATITSLISLLGVIAIVVYLSFYQLPLVYVDSAKLVNGYKGMQVARQAYQQKAAQWKANIDTLTSEVKNEIFKYEKEVGKMSAREKQLSQELIQTKQNQLNQYQQAMNAQAQQEDGQMTKMVLDEINAFLKKYGKSKNYRIILAATDYGNIAYADEIMDITDEVLEGLNAQYEGK